MEAPLSLSYALAGPPEGEPVVLLHGFPLDHSMWAHASQALAAEGYRVVLPDLRGHGESPLGHGPATMSRCAADVLRAADELGIQEFVLGGHSMGGYVALEIARLHPERVRALLLVHTRAEPDTEEARERRAATAEEVSAGGLAALAARMADQMLPEPTRAERPDLVAEVRAMMERAPLLGVVQALHGLADRPDARPTLPRLLMPTLVVAGTEDTIVTIESSEAMAAALPHAETILLFGVGHLAPLEAPERFNAALLEWLSASVRRDRRGP